MKSLAYFLFIQHDDRGEHSLEKGSAYIIEAVLVADIPELECDAMLVAQRDGGNRKRGAECAKLSCSNWSEGNTDSSKERVRRALRSTVPTLMT